jgi:hypothetical protein
MDQKHNRKTFDTYCHKHRIRVPMAKVVQVIGAGVNIFLKCPECGAKR